MAVILDKAYAYGLTGIGTKVRLGEMRMTIADAQPIGGKIFHIENSDNGASYIFFDEHGRILNPSSYVDSNNIEHLNADCAKVVGYIRKGTPTADKFYVVGKDGDDNMGVSSVKHWTYHDGNDWVYESLGTVDGIGKGKSNTALIMAKDSGAYIKSASGSQTLDTLWKWLKSINDANTNGCNDWFIGSKAEIEKLRTVLDASGNNLTTWFAQSGGYYLWSSFEYSSAYAWYWTYNGQYWADDNKFDTNLRGFAVRAF